MRLFYLQNHTAARHFEIPILKKIGFSEVFIPKKTPQDVRFRSGTVTFEEDAFLNIPAHALSILNEADWYQGASAEAWEIANQYFDYLLFTPFEASGMGAVLDNFLGAIILRQYGHPLVTLSEIIDNLLGAEGERKIRGLGRRFFMGYAYEKQNNLERDFLKNRAVYLPLGITESKLANTWTGEDKRLMFVCPDIIVNPYYQDVYQTFKKNFSDIPHLITGSQPIRPPDANVSPFLPHIEYIETMQKSRVMFYHSQERYHVNSHPFEAMQYGMPVVYLQGGLLETLAAGKSQPGKARNIKAAHDLVQRILNDDEKLIKKIQAAQKEILYSALKNNDGLIWKEGFQYIQEEYTRHKKVENAQPPRKKRIAVILPEPYGGGTLRGMQVLAHAILKGSQEAGEEIEVVLGLPHSEAFQKNSLIHLPASITCRTFQWKLLSSSQAQNVVNLAGIDYPLSEHTYTLPDDGIQQFMDCDLWVFVSDRIFNPILPVRPYALMVYDYIQRYIPEVLPAERTRTVFASAYSAKKVWVTTEFTKNDALQFVGLEKQKVKKLPMLFPIPSTAEIIPSLKKNIPFFLWTTNPAKHKNHENAFNALIKYYTMLEGKLNCYISGPLTDQLHNTNLPHLSFLSDLLKSYPEVFKKIKILGGLTDDIYYENLKKAHFLWHPALVDNGTFSVIEAAYYGTPALSSDYPAMLEINQQYQLNLRWCDPHDADNMAHMLKDMEDNANTYALSLPSQAFFKEESINCHAKTYWEAIKEVL